MHRSQRSGRPRTAGSADTTHTGVTELTDAVGVLWATTITTDLDQRPDAARHEVHRARLDLQIALHVEQRVSTHHPA